MSWDSDKSFVDRVNDFIKKSTPIISGLSEPLRKELESTIRKLEKAKEAVNNINVPSQIDLWLNIVFDELFDSRRKSVIGILTSWFSDLNETDIWYIKDLFRLNIPKRIAKISNEWLARILKWNFTREDLICILDDLPFIDKSSCLSFISWKIWITKEDADTIKIVLSWSFTMSELLATLKIFNWISNEKTKTHIANSIWIPLDWIPLIINFLNKSAKPWDAWILFNMILNNKNPVIRSLVWEIALINLGIFSIDDFLTLLRDFWNIVKWKIFKKDRELSRRQIGIKWKMNIDILILIINNFKFGKIDHIEILKTFSFLNEDIIKSIINIILKDLSIHEPDKYRIMNILWEDYWHILWEVLGLWIEMTRRVTEVIIHSRRSEHSLAKKYEILISLPVNRRYVMFWILLWNFSIETLESMKSQVIWEKRRNWALKNVEEVERDVAKNVCEIIWINPAQLERTSLEKYFSPTKKDWNQLWTKKETSLAKRFRFLSWLPNFVFSSNDVKDLSWEVRNSLREVWIWEWNISTIRNASEKEFAKLLWVIKWCKYEWRKVILEWFLKNKWIRLTYWRLVDCFIMDDFISSPEIFSERYFRNLISSEPNNIDRVRNVKYLLEIYWKDNQDILSPSIIRMIATLSPEDFEESINEIKAVWIDISRSAWFDWVDISSMALLIKQWKIKMSDFYDDKSKKWIQISIWTNIARRRKNIQYILKNYQRISWKTLVQDSMFSSFIDNFDNNTLVLFTKNSREEIELNRCLWEISNVIFAWTKQLTTKEERERDSILNRYNNIWRNLKFWNISTDFLLRNANNPFFASSNTIAFVVALIRAWMDGAFNKINWAFIVNEEDIEKIIKEWSKYAYLLKNDIHILIWNKYIEDKNNN